ncbi:SBBP repeat-containing protein [Cytobacillus firmus]|uniref:DUF7948 domain-containing protein n=1 Tax=Cytobacillus firmus TaxID=1399 RepID=UPI0018CDE26D|nr:SBBP repeat-containing protein [Cytobacillus firmus]
MTITDEIYQNIWESYGKLPIAFIPNRGQIHQNAHFYTQRSGLGILFTPQEVLLTFLEKEDSNNQSKTFGQLSNEEVGLKKGGEKRGMCLTLSFLNGNPAVKLEGREEGTGYVNYLKGNDQEKWLTNLPMYHEVVYKELWPGIDLVFRGESGQLKYEFLVQPGADIEKIQLTYRGAADLSLDESENLQIHTEYGVLIDEKPVSYQTIDGIQLQVDSSFTILQGESGEKHFQFNIGNQYDSRYPLIIDPGLVYSTYLGGTGDEAGGSIAVDSAGNAYITGSITSTFDFPTTPGVFQTTSDGYQDAFVTKLNPTGSALVYSTLLGGAQYFDQGLGIAVDAAGNAYVTGLTGSPDFPTTTGAFDTTFKGGSIGTDAFVTKLNATGSALIYSTFISGTDDDEGIDIVVDGSGNAYVTGNTTSFDFPTTSGAFRTAHNGGFYDAFVTKINPTGSTLVYSTYLGGIGFDQASGIAIDAAGNAYVTGFTDSSNFPTTPGVFDTTFNGGEFDAFVTKLNATGSAVVYSTYLGGELRDIGNGIAVDAAGNAYVTGLTTSRNFPTTSGAFDTTFNGGPFDAFVTKLNPTGSMLLYSTFLGGTRNDQGTDIAVDAAGNAYVTGFTESIDFPTTSGAFDTTFNGHSDAFVTKLNSTGSALLYSTYLGGSLGEQALALDIDSAGNAYITGYTISEDYPTTPGAFDSTYNGFSDAFAAKISTESSTTPMPIANVSPTSINFGNQPVNTSSSPQTVTVTNTGTADLIINNVMIAGANPTDFQVVSNMCTIVNPGNSCTIRVTFNPTSTGPRSAALNIFDNASDSPQQVLLNGNGLPSADLMISKNAFAVPAGRNKQITYTITVMNMGPNTASNVVVTDRLQSNTQFVSASNSQGTFTAPRRGTSGTVTFTLGNISAGSSATMTIVVTARANAFVSNTATVSSSTFDPGLHPNSASVLIM